MSGQGISEGVFQIEHLIRPRPPQRRVVVPSFVFPQARSSTVLPPNPSSQSFNASKSTWKVEKMAVFELLGYFSWLAALKTRTLFLAPTLVLFVAGLLRLFFTWRRLRHVPGPFLNSITPLAMTWHGMTEDMTVYTHSLTEKYGPLVRISPNVVMYSDPDTFRRVCSVKAKLHKRPVVRILPVGPEAALHHCFERQ